MGENCILMLFDYFKRIELRYINEMHDKVLSVQYGVRRIQSSFADTQNM